MTPTVLDDQSLGIPDTGSPLVEPDRSRWQRIRPLIMRLHFYAGLFIGPFILLAGITGFLYTLTPQLDAIVYKHELTVDHVGTMALPLSTQVERALAAHPEGTLSSVRPPVGPGETTQVVLKSPDVPDTYSKTVFVDPYTGDVRGALTTYGQWLPIRAWFDEFHRNLHLGAVGRNYSELAASWMWIVALGGLALWLAQRRSLRRALIPEPATRGRRRSVNWHGIVGVWILVGLLGLSVTGLTWSKHAGGNISELRSQLSWSKPTVSSALPHSTKRPVIISDIDTVAATANAQGLQGPMWITPKKGAAWTAFERKRNYPTRYDAIAVDPATGAVVDRINFAQWSPVAKLTQWAIDIHMGIVFGWVNQLALMLLAVALISVVIRGYMMWWKRRPPTRSDRRRRCGGRPPRRGALAELTPAEMTIAIIVLAGIGWFLPLFGISLVVFVIIDVLVTVLRRGDDHSADETADVRESLA